MAYPDGNHAPQHSEFIKKISVHIDLLHAVVPKAVLATAFMVESVKA